MTSRHHCCTHAIEPFPLIVSGFLRATPWASRLSRSFRLVSALEVDRISFEFVCRSWDSCLTDSCRACRPENGRPDDHEPLCRAAGGRGVHITGQTSSEETEFTGPSMRSDAPEPLRLRDPLWRKGLARRNLRRPLLAHFDERPPRASGKNTGHVAGTNRSRRRQTNMASWPRTRTGRASTHRFTPYTVARLTQRAVLKHAD